MSRRSAAPVRLDKLQLAQGSDARRVGAGFVLAGGRLTLLGRPSS
jgi:hypothetical protein